MPPRAWVFSTHKTICLNPLWFPFCVLARPQGQGPRGPAPPLAEKADNSPEDQAREMEKAVNALIEASADAAARQDYVQALERAKEAVRELMMMMMMIGLGLLFENGARLTH